ncbi:MAG: U32 family peptidase [Bacilli bacterium]
MNKPELLAPAGDLERLKWAVLYGADAVYVGGKTFSLRANAKNFTLDDLKQGVAYTHHHHKKIYVTINIVLHNTGLKPLIDYLKQLEKIKIDAIIVSDPTIIKLAKQYTNLEIHLSTQQSALNYETLEFFKQQGVKRVVLAREVTKEEIKKIKSKVDIDLECFIHGSMCASYSGRCVLSNFLTHRDANRGGCSQICRWDFDLLNKHLKPIKGEQDFTFCTKDLSMLKYIPEMIDLGITSFKIEGRMRSIYYIATVLYIYRQVIDEYCNKNIKYAYNENYEYMLNHVANRDSIPQFFNQKYDHTVQYYNGRQELSNQDFLGIVLDYKDNYATIEQRNYFKKGDIVLIFGPNKPIKTITINEIYDEKNQLIDIVRHPRQIVKIKTNQKVSKYDIMQIKKTIDK